MNRKDDRVLWAARVFLVAVFLLSVAKAARLSLVHDEALTYFIQLTLSFGGILTFGEGIWMPNNHFLNSLLIKVFTHLLGASELVIRLPALLGHALYLFGIYRITRLFCRGALLLAALGLLTLNPFVLDFFSCARGYGLGLGCSALGLYFFFKRISGLWPRQDLRHNFFCVSLLALAVFSHLSFLVMFAALVAAIICVELAAAIRVMKQTPSDSLFLKLFLRKIVAPVAPGVIFLVSAYAGPVRKILEANDHLNAGRTSGTEGFWQDTVRSLIDAALYTRAYPIPHLAGIILFFIVGCLLLALVFLMGRKLAGLSFDLGDRILSWSLILLVACAAGIVLQHVFSQREYATDRWAIYLYGLFSIFVAALGHSFRHLAQAGLRNTLNAAFFAGTALLLAHGASCVNLTHFSTWAYDASTREVLDDIVADRQEQRSDNTPVLLGNNLLFEPSLNYYIYKKNLPWLGLVDRRGPDGAYDYYVLLPEDRPLIDKYGLSVMKTYAVSGVILAKP